ncbi:MAG: GyrI-like domain-containing protein [Anaerolineaceae bacterium]|nr:GyrI-like domain-containing protein [Anaerolineaceae bacterium]
MEKIDYKKQLKNLYGPSTKKPVIVDVPEMNFLMIDGHGDPNTSIEFKQAVSSLYPLAYGLKFAVKKRKEIDFGVLPLEGLWWAEEMADFSVDDKSNWDWTLMIMQPEFVTAELVEEITAEVARKKNPEALAKIRFETYHEGSSVQLMHIGPFADEGPNIARMHAFAEEEGYHLAGKHHEIYLKDFTKTAPERMKTILRQPIKKGG